jgi:hypothetical protein
MQTNQTNPKFHLRSGLSRKAQRYPQKIETTIHNRRGPKLEMFKEKNSIAVALERMELATLTPVVGN